MPPQTNSGSAVGRGYVGRRVLCLNISGECQEFYHFVRATAEGDHSKHGVASLISTRTKFVVNMNMILRESTSV